MTRLIGNACRKLGVKLVSWGLYLSAIGIHLAPRKRPVVVVWHEPAAWTSAHEQRPINGPGPQEVN